MKTQVKKYLSGLMLSMMLVLTLSLVAQDNPPPQDNGAPPVDAPQANAPVTLQTFYDQLAPYGQWVNYPNYGYVFIPSVAPGFTPYSTNGHWVYNDAYGWTWASDYAWGWATFHYGRWNYDAAYGWFWIPDLNWGPAWVAWRNCQGYYGWAPLPFGVSINVGFGGGYNIAAEHWCFVPQEHLCELNLGAFFIPREHNYAFIQHSTIIDRMDYDNGHRFGYFKGPDRVEVEGYTHHPIQVVSVDRYRYAPARTVVVEHRDAQQRVVVEQRHDAPVRQDNHVVAAPRVEQRSTPTHYVEARNVPQRGGDVHHGR
jgi:hypothetical protein